MQRLGCETHSTEQTRALGALLGQCMNKPVVVLLVGPLGAGKTVLVRGMARGLGYSGRVRSPTFTLANHYDTDTLAMYHLDLYRFEACSEVDLMAIEEYLYGSGVCVVEWAERFRESWPPNYLLVELERGRGKQREERWRSFAMTASGEAPEALLSCAADRIERSCTIESWSTP